MSVKYYKILGQYCKLHCIFCWFQSALLFPRKIKKTYLYKEDQKLLQCFIMMSYVTLSRIHEKRCVTSEHEKLQNEFVIARAVI